MIQAKKNLRIVGVLLGGLVAGGGTVGWAQRPVSFSTPGGCLPDGAPISVAVGDFNGDGVLDLVVAHFYSGVVSVLLGVGDGTFVPVGRFGVGPYPSSVAVADFNGDGVLDLVVVNRTDSVSVLLGIGDGTFGPERRFGEYLLRPYSVAVGDFNGDGVLDLAVTNVGTRPLFLGSVSILLGIGDGTFGPERRILASYGSAPLSVAVGDFNGDGILDLAVGDAGFDSVWVMLGIGDGTFSPERFAVGSSPWGVAVGDFNGDGALDLATANVTGFPCAGSVSILLGFGDGSFSLEEQIGVGRCLDSVAVGDFNGDGVLDLAVVDWYPDWYPGSVWVMLGIGDGTFGPEQRVSVGYAPQSVAVGDFNGDGVLDLAVANVGNISPPPVTGSVSVLLGLGDGSFFDECWCIFCGVSPIRRP